MASKNYQYEIKESSISIVPSNESTNSPPTIVPVAHENSTVPFERNQQPFLQNIASEHGVNMSDNSSTTNSSDSNEDYDRGDSDKLDILSKDFDPLAAMYCKDIGKIKNIIIKMVRVYTCSESYTA